VAPVLGDRLVRPERIRCRPVRQLEQERGADVVGAVGRADRSAKDEARAVRGEIRFVRVELVAVELGRAGLGSGAQELLQALAAIIGLALAEAVRPRAGARPRRDRCKGLPREYNVKYEKKAGAKKPEGIPRVRLSFRGRHLGRAARQRSWTAETLPRVTISSGGFMRRSSSATSCWRSSRRGQDGVHGFATRSGWPMC
jgi:hypothetical protein